MRQCALSPHNFAGEPHAASTPVVLPPGVSQTDLWLDLDEPRLWWPWDMGAQNLYDVAVSVSSARVLCRATDEAGELDRVGDRIGLRHLRKEHAIRLGDLPERQADLLPRPQLARRACCVSSSCSPGPMTRARYEFDVQLMKRTPT